METPDGRQMDCDDVRAALLLASDGELSVHEGRLLDAHLATCAECRRNRARLAGVEQRLSACRDALDSLEMVRSVPRSARARSVAVSAAAAAILLLMVWAGWPKHVDKSAAGQVPRGPAFTNGGDADSGEVVALSLPLAPIGNPFSDGSLPNPEVRGELVVDPDGLRRIRLAN